MYPTRATAAGRHDVDRDLERLDADTAVRRLYDDVRAARGAAFRLREFTDALMRIGPLPIEEVRRLMLPFAPNNPETNEDAEENPPRG